MLPDIVLTSDVIVGFPGETEAEFEETLSLVKEVGFDALFTFIYSPRPGTPAAELPDPVSREEKQKWFDELLRAQNDISAKKHAAYVGTTQRVLVDGESGDARWPLSARTAGGRLVHLTGGKSAIGTFQTAQITDSNTWASSAIWRPERKAAPSRFFTARRAFFMDRTRSRPRPGRDKKGACAMQCIKCGMEMKKVNLFGLPGVDMCISQGVPNWQGMEVRSAVRCFVCPAAAM